MMRPGYVPAHSSSCQSLAARTTARASSGSLTPSWYRWPENPASDDGKHTDAYMPLMSMSWMRAWMSYAPRRISSNRVGSNERCSNGLPTTALRPTL